MSDNFFSKLISDFLVNYFLDILHQFIITNNYLHFSSYFRQSKILSDINGRRTLRGPTDVHPAKERETLHQRERETSPQRETSH